MNITEKLAYIKGLAEGLSLDNSKPEVKVINEILNLLEDMAYSVDDMEDLYDDLSAQVDEIDHDLAEVEEEVFDYDFDDYDDDECDCGCHDDFDDEDNPFYEVTCGACGQKLNVSEDVLLEGEIECPNCGELLEFDFSDFFDDEFGECDDCDCEDCKPTEEKE